MPALRLSSLLLLATSTAAFAAKHHSYDSTTLFKRQSSSSNICTRQVVQSGDTCSILQQKYNVSQLDLQSFNGGQQCGPTFPATGQVICVSQGLLPPIPAPYPDGSCSIYVVQNGDSCEKIAQNTTFSISPQQLGTFNNASCGVSFPVVGRTICISKGALTGGTGAASITSSPLAVPLLLCGVIVIVLIMVAISTGRSNKDKD